jgi:hypothetical protein
MAGRLIPLFKAESSSEEINEDEVFSSDEFFN